MDSMDFVAVIDDPVLEGNVDSLILVWPSSETNLELETVPSTTDLDSECCVNDLPEPDLLD